MRTVLSFLILISLSQGAFSAATVANPPAVSAASAQGDLDKEAVDKLIQETQKFEAQKAQVPEESQAVFKDQPKPAPVPSAIQNPWTKMVVSLVIVIAFLGGLALVYKRWPWAQKMTKRARMIEMLSQHHLGQRKSLAVVRVAGESILIGITDQNINVLKSLSLLEEEVPPRQQFKETLTQSIKKQDEPAEEFTIKNIKDIVGKKLKNFKEI